MKFKDNVPIYLQIEQYLNREIATGKLQAGQKIPSVRQLALKLTVNVNTVQRALQQMNEHGILKVKRGEGNFVTTDEALLKQTKDEQLTKFLRDFVNNMHTFGITNREILTQLQDYLDREGYSHE